MGSQQDLIIGLFQDCGMYPQVGNNGEETYLLNRIKPVDFGTWFTEFNKQLLLRETEEKNWWLDDVDFIHWLAAGCFAGVKFQALGSNNLNGWGLSSVQFQHKPSQFFWERSREHWTERAAFGFPVCCFPLKNPPFFNDLRPFRTQEESRYQVELTDGSEAGKIKAGCHGFLHKKWPVWMCRMLWFFHLPMGKIHGIFPTQMTIQVVPSSLEQSQWVHRPQTGCICTLANWRPSSPKIWKWVSGRAGRLLVKTWHNPTKQLSLGKWWSTVKLPCCSILCNYMGPFENGVFPQTSNLNGLKMNHGKLR